MSASLGRPAELAPDVIAEFLSATALFRDLPEKVATQVSAHVRAVDFSSGEGVVPPGAASGEIGVVFAGRVFVVRINPLTRSRDNLAELGVGESFGEVGAILETADPTAIEAGAESTVLFLPQAVVAQLSTQLAPFASALAKRISSRLIRLSATSSRPSPTAPAASGNNDGGVRMVPVSRFKLADDVVRLIPARIIREQRALPLVLNGRDLTVGFVDPFSPAPLAEIRRALPTVEVRVVGISADDFNQAVVRLKLDSNASGGSEHERLSPKDIAYDGMANEERDVDHSAVVIGDDVINLATKIVITGIQLSASDIHIENDSTGIRVRYRVAGVLTDWDQFIPSSFSKGIVARFKVLAGLDTTERRRPQDGRIGLRAGRREVDLRVSTAPALRGEKIVMRIFEAAAMMRPLDQVFVLPGTLDAVREALNLPHGAILVAGPRGSGKSSTLYAALGESKRTRPNANIVMLEDPVECRLDGVTQIQVNPAIDLTFARILRSVLRQDPDVLMVGELRDLETAELALEAAMTGRLLLSSIHANTAMAALQRLIHLGCSETAIAQSLSLILVQRLVSRTCPECVVNEPPPPLLHQTLAKRGIVESSSPIPLPRGQGCKACNQTGNSGRIAVIESLQITDAIRNALLAGTHLDEIEVMAEKTEALLSFRKAAALLMSRQLISPTEALLAVAK